MLNKIVAIGTSAVIIIATIIVLVVVKPGMSGSSSPAPTEPVTIEATSAYVPQETIAVIETEEEKVGLNLSEYGQKYASSNPQEYLIPGPTGGHTYYEVDEAVFEGTDWLNDINIFRQALLTEDEYELVQDGDVVIYYDTYSVADDKISVDYTCTIDGEEYSYTLKVDRVNKVISGDY